MVYEIIFEKERFHTYHSLYLKKKEEKKIKV